jgi:hypothetical protein
MSIEFEETAAVAASETSPTHVLTLEKGVEAKAAKALGLISGYNYFGDLQDDGSFLVIEPGKPQRVIPSSVVNSKKVRILRYVLVPPGPPAVERRVDRYGLTWD